MDTLDPKLVAAVLGVDPEGVMIYLADRLDASPNSVNGDIEVRHLTPVFALGALHRGKEIEQFIGGIERDGRQGVQWIAISPGCSGVTVRLSEVVDAGTDTFHDVTEFPPLEPDEESWGREVAVLATPEEALQVAVQELGADPGRWVNQGIVCDEYRDFRIARKAQSPTQP